MTANRIRRGGRTDDGAALVIALVIVSVVALVLGGLLSFAWANEATTVATRSQAADVAAAEGGAQVAIKKLQTGSYDNDTGSATYPYCFGTDPSSSLTVPYPSGTGSTYVQCTPDAASGVGGGLVPINSQNKPGYAIITLKGAITSSDNLKVHGGVYSNSSIAGTVSLDAGDAWAKGACPATTVTPPGTLHCNTGLTIADPNYTNDLGGSVPALQTPPTSCVNGVAVFTPGYYDNATTLNTATNLCSTAWFQPGTYYFDFHNDGCANVCPSALYGTGTTSSSNVWTISGKSVVGGTPTDANGNVIARPSTSPTMPGSCQSPITSVNAQGVQFVFGGNSQIYIDQNSHVELCGTYHSNRPPIELYGLKTGSTPTATNDAGRDISNGGSVVSAGSFTGATVANLKTGGAGAKWTTANGNKVTTSLSINGFAPSTTVPKGAILTGATLHVTHQDGDAANAAPTATVQVGTATTSTLTIPASATATTANLAITGTDLTALQKQVHDNGYTQAGVTYTVSAKKNNATSSIGPITLDLTYYLPVLRGQGATCVDGTSGSCSFLSMKNGNNKILLYLQGTTYLPYADVNILLGNFSSEVVKFGIVTRQLEFAITNGNPLYTGPIFEIPDDSPSYGIGNTVVYLTVYVCPSSSTCSASGKLRLRVRVQIYDPSGSPQPPNRTVTVQGWAVSR